MKYQYNMGSVTITFVVLIVPFLQSSFGKPQEIHKVWSSLREPINWPSTTTLQPEVNVIGKVDADGNDKRVSHSHTTLVYSSPVCVGRCIIFQIFWNNSTSTVFGRKLPQIATFPRPQMNSTDTKTMLN